MKSIKAVKKPIPVRAKQTNKHIDVKTLEGTMHANPGDYIITGPEGEKWPVKKEIFEKTYEILEEDG
ncbi:PGDYG domain-containing protein [Desemzia incerta]|uniref:PGDYG domain-containing protein n=1 Tax=Desemzia incerta TaxID=82801 RepID=UPI003D05A471